MAVSARDDGCHGRRGRSRRGGGSRRRGPSAMPAAPSPAYRVYSHDGPIGRRKRGYNLTMDQSDAGSV
eukprot:7901630-Pyramimonas_sp.AAC.1